MTVVGVLALLGVCAREMPRNSQKPASQQWLSEVARIDVENSARSSREIADRFAGKQPKCPQDFPECNTIPAQRFPEDQWATWTPKLYANTWWKNISGEFGGSWLFKVPAALTTIGLFLWLLYDASLGRLVSWIKHGSIGNA